MSAPPPVAVAATIRDVRAAVALARRAGRTVGFVPTMGALHAGHARLIETCRRDVGDGLVVVSIYVNPTQFAPTEDLARYPRTPEADLAVCADAGADLAFMPTDSEMYPSGQLATFVEVPGPSGTLEGERRPTHFRGVATVVLKLFHIVGPDLAHFGEKDYQQLLVIRRMVADLDVPVEVRGVPTVREPDGLALSSRNRYLDPDDRRAAVVLWRALQAAQSAAASGERSADRIRQLLRQTVESERRAQLDYAEVADSNSLEPLAILEPGRPARALLAARIGPARLIDNAALPFPAPASSG